MADDGLIGIFVVAGDADAAAADPALPEHGDLLRDCLVDELLLHLCIVEVAGNNDQSSEYIKADQFIDTAGDIAPVLRPVIIHRAVERSNAAAFFPCCLIEFRKEICFQKCMRLR